MTSVATRAYSLVRERPLERMQGRLIELVHEPTGMRHLHVAYDDRTSGFYLLVRTLAQDSSGIAHVLEHVVLQGSKRYPIAGVLTHVRNRSLATAVSAHTREDHTMYNFASRYEDDFLSLLDLYVDSVFQPLLEGEAFLQEGWRYKLSGEGEMRALERTGVVLNEMRGTVANDFMAMWFGMGAALYPGTPYGFQSGGDPNVMPTLTFEKLRDFHARHYTPANSVVITTGSIDLDRVLDVAARALDGVPRGEPVPLPQTVVDPVARHRVPRSGDGDSTSQAAVVWATPGVYTDPFDYLAHTVLAEALAGTPEAPLQRALLQAFAGSAPPDTPALVDRYPELVFAAGAKGLRPEDADRVQSLVLEELEKLAAAVPARDVERALGKLELELWDRSEAMYMGLVPMDFWIRILLPAYRPALAGGDIHGFIDYAPDLDRIRSLARHGYLEDLVKTSLLENSRRSLLELVPDLEAEASVRKAQRAELERTLSVMTAADIAAIDALPSQLEARLKNVSLDALPDADVPGLESAARAPSPLEVLAGPRGDAHLYSVPGRVAQVEVRAEMRVSRADQNLLPLLARSIAAHAATDGVAVATGVAITRAGGDPIPHLWIRVRALDSRRDRLLDALTAALDPAGITRDLIAQQVAAITADLEHQLVYTWSAPELALRLAVARLDATGALEDRLFGVGALYVARGLAAGALTDDIRRLVSLIKLSAVEVFCAGDDSLTRELAPRVLEALGGDATLAALAPAVETSVAAGGSARTIGGSVAFNAMALPAVTFDHARAGSYPVLARVLRAPLVARVREEGGAYGTEPRADHESGRFGFVSWYDPHILRTQDAFTESLQALLDDGVESGVLRPAKARAFADLDPELIPLERARRHWEEGLNGRTDEAWRAFRTQLLATTGEDLSAIAAGLLREVPARGCIAPSAMVESAVRERPDLFDDVRPA